MHEADPLEKELRLLAEAPRAPRGKTVALVIPPSPQIPTPGREFLVTGPFEGFTSVATLVRRLGYGLKVIDCRFSGNERPEHVLKELEGADIAGFATYCDSFVFLEKMTAEVRRACPGLKQFLGGPLVTSLPELLLSSTAADCALLGEAELTLIEFLDAVLGEGRADLAGVKGLALKTPGGVRLTAPRPQIADLDSLPFPDYTVWPNYRDIVKNGQVIISTTRGCPCACTFCFKTIPALRAKSLARFEREVAWLKETTKFDYTWLNDLTFNADPARGMKVADILLRAGVKYHVFARVTGVTREFCETLRRTGCLGIWFGIESYDQAVLDRNRKNTTIEAIDRAVGLAAAAGLQTRGLFIVGLPGETEESLKKMFSYIKAGDFIPLVKYLVPFPGTDIYAAAVKEGKIKDTAEFLRKLSVRRVGDFDDELFNLTGLDENLLRGYFHDIWQLTREKEPA